MISPKEFFIRELIALFSTHKYPMTNEIIDSLNKIAIRRGIDIVITKELIEKYLLLS
jgi:hypothetical protein